MDELGAFVRRCMDEDERAALAAYGRNWDVDHEWVVTEDMHLAEVETASAQHVARWDPARVLAEVEAKRRVLDRYADMHWHAPAIPGATSSILQVEDTGACRTCVTVQILAQPYAGQDGWREEWAL